MIIKYDNIQIMRNNFTLYYNHNIQVTVFEVSLISFKEFIQMAINLIGLIYLIATQNKTYIYILICRIA